MNLASDTEFDHALQQLDSHEGGLGGLTRRQFLKYCTGVAATLVGRP